MPRTKRVKRTPPEEPPAAAPAPAPAPAPSKRETTPSDPEAQEPGYGNDIEPSAGTPSPAPTDSIDPALLDEEDAPGESSPKEKQKPYTSGFNALKSHHGQIYTGMAVGGSHTWNYEPGVWKETKEEPDRWSIEYNATKRRARNAPRGSGAPVGTEYHWFVVGHQHVKKIDANTYETRLTGAKYKLAHKNAAASSWSVPTVKGQREREVELLEDAKRRVQGLPPVLAGEKVRVEKKEKGQQSLDSMLKRKR